MLTALFVYWFLYSEAITRNFVHPMRVMDWKFDIHITPPYIDGILERSILKFPCSFSELCCGEKSLERAGISVVPIPTGPRNTSRRGIFSNLFNNRRYLIC